MGAACPPPPPPPRAFLRGAHVLAPAHTEKDILFRRMCVVAGAPGGLKGDVLAHFSRIRALHQEVFDKHISLEAE